MIIHRPEEERRINMSNKWVMIYGRRKTGKTFLVENFIDFDEYFFVKRDRSIISKENNRSMNYTTFIEIFRRLLNEEKIVVVDEFHRLGNDFFDFLHHVKKQGKLILISSTLFLSKELFSSRSSLLGFFTEAPIGLIKLEDCVRKLKKFKIDKKELVELSVLLREPIAIDYFDEKKWAREIFTEVLIGSIKTIPALIGEIFAEEERSISGVYEGILRAIANGKVVSGEISNYLFSRKLIKKDDPSIIQQYLNNLANFGIIKKIKVYNKKRFVYKHVSPLVRIFYYADEKYNISEREPLEKEIKEIVDDVLPKIIEDDIREFLARRYGLRESIIESDDYDVDACLLKFKKPEIVAEIKWKKEIKKRDIIKAEKNLSRVESKRKILFTPDKRNLSSNVLEIVDISDFC